MALSVEIVSKQINKIQANVVVRIFGTENTRDEIIFGNFALYIRTMAPNEDSFSIQVMLKYMGKENNFLCACKLNSSKMGIVNQRFICDDSQWRILYEHETQTNGSVVTFDLSVEVERILMESPFAVLYDDNELTYFELRAGDGSVRFHSAVLATASPSLRRMLTGRWLETETRCLQTKDTSRETLQHLKGYLYLNVLPDHGIEHLLLLASYYLMTDLENRCISKLLSTITAETSCELMKFALSHNLMNLYYSFLKSVQEGGITVDDKKLLGS